MLLWEDGVSERDLSGWKLGSPPPLLHPGVPASTLAGGSTITSSGRGGAPGSPGLGRLEEEEVVEETAAMLTPEAQGRGSPPLCTEGRVMEPTTSEVEGLRSPSGWKSRVEQWENMVEGVLLLLGGLRLLSEEEETEELEACAVQVKKR